MDSKKIVVGLTERHGMADEQAAFPIEHIEYRFLETKRIGHPILKSPIKGYFSRYNEDCDIVEAILSPIHTNKPWMYSLACFQEAVAFNFKGLPIPRPIRCRYMNYLFQKPNFKNFLFWSEAGKRTISTYGRIRDENVLSKAEVVYPAIRELESEKIKFKDKNLTILFSGDFFRKGGVNVIDAFEELQKSHFNLTLYVCSDERIDFNTDDVNLKSETLQRIKKNNSIIFGRVPRSKMINEILPNTDVYLLPTYDEAFGFAVLEAMAYGIPVISTNSMAIPEMIAQGNSGYMIDISDFDCENLFKGYYVRYLPENLRNHVTEQLCEYLDKLLGSLVERKRMGLNGVEIARSKFSLKARNDKMAELYQKAFS